MSSIYDVDWETVCDDLYPTNKRLPIMLNKEYCFLSGMNFIQKLFGYLMDGTTESNYDPVVVYGFGQLVIFQRKVYFKNEITAGYAAGEDPTTKYWSLVLTDFIGTNEKVYFGPGKMVLEYALNRIFQTVYRQPIGAFPPHSDIYIVNNGTSAAQFYVGLDDAESSYMPLVDGEAIQFITLSDLDPTLPNFSVMVPTALLSALSADMATAKAIISSVVNRYRLAGYTFNVIAY